MPDGLRFLVLFAIYSSTLLIPPRTSAINASEEVLQSVLFDDLMHWAAKLSGLPDATHMPAIQPIGLDQLVHKVCPEDPVNCRSLISFYSTEEESIFYLDSLDLNDDTDLSFIVHEMVHHLQYAVQGEQLFATCQNLLAAESQAYAVQNKYLTQFKQWRRVGEAIRFINCDALDNSRSDASANQLRLGDAMLRRLLNHTALKTVVLHLHYVGLHEGDIAGAFVTIQNALAELMTG